MTFIYARMEPDTDEIRYIGKSNDPQERLISHISESRRLHTHCANWINSVAARGLTPRTEIIAEVPIDEWPFWERHYIKYFRDIGFNLVNTTPGGEGVFSTPEIRAKQRLAMVGREATSEARGKMRKAAEGRRHSMESRAKISVAHMGRMKSRNTSGFVGVSQLSSGKKWRASYGKKTIGCFQKIEDAVFARNLTSALYGNVQ